jgi:hypothetical protein
MGVLKVEIGSRSGEAFTPTVKRGLVHFGLGAALLVGAILGLRADVSWLAEPFYAWVWWGYILMLDGFSVVRRGDSLLTTRRRFFFPICVWSITFWFFFEMINARIQNWYYVGVFPTEDFLWGCLFAVLAFATVFMGIFHTVDALNASGLWRNWKGKRRTCPLWLSYVLQLIGLFMGGLALAFPYYLAPLIWGSFTLVVDPWNYRRGARSLLRDLEHGDFGLIARLLLAGLICGVVWESLNFFAPQKWIYTVRGLEGLKVFEMPLIGFLGFPALALDSLAGFALCSSWLLGNRSWERTEDLSYALRIRPEPPALVFWSAALPQMVFWAAIALFATPVNVGSIQLDLRDLGLTPLERTELANHGLTRPRQLLRAADTNEKQNALCRTLSWRTERLEEICRRADLYTFKGIGPIYGGMLEKVGILRPDDLKTWNAEALHARLASIESRHIPRLDFVRAWILAARDRNLIQNSR